MIKAPTKSEEGERIYRTEFMNQVFDPQEKTEVIPVLEPDEYVVTFKLNGGTLDDETEMVIMAVKENTAITLPEPVRSGYTFNYWDNEEYKAGTEYLVTEDHTFKAIWTKDEGPEPVMAYFIFMDPDGGTLDGQAGILISAYEEGTSITLPEPVRSGYTFNYWDYEGSRVDTEYTVTGDCTLTAIWMKNPGPEPVKEYAISFDLGGGTLGGKTGIVTFEYKEGDVIVLPRPVRQGYSFDYWEGSRYEAGADYIVSKDHTFKAIWIKIDTPHG